MESSQSLSPRCKIPVIVGPTGSGKTGVAVEIALEVAARQVGGFSGAEIISADSRAIYKGMDIGTAKPSTLEQGLVPHHGIDLAVPGARFTVADWKVYAEQKISEIWSRGRVPLIVGGTGLYVDALIYNYQFSESAKKSYSDRQKMDNRFVVFGIKWEMVDLRERLEERVNKLFVQELYGETERLVTEYGWGSQAMKSNIYQFAWGYLQGELSLEEAKRLAVLDDYHLAKRQMTWFKRNSEISWLPLEKIRPAVLKCIQDG